MRVSHPDPHLQPDNPLLVAYVAELELEVDRLRKQGDYLRHIFIDELKLARGAVGDNSRPDDAPAAVQSLERLTKLIEDLEDPPGCQWDDDEVTAIPMRALIEHVFRWQQRQSGTSRAKLRLELSSETINWFPMRMRNILENLISNALKFRDPEKGETRVTAMLNHRAESIELRITDNGLGIPCDESVSAAEFLQRSAFRRGSGLGVGLAVVKLLVEQSGGSLSVDSGAGKGTNFIALLPRYELGDYLT